MRVLALDSAMTGCSACVYDKRKGVLAKNYIDISRGQAEHLMPLVNNVINKSGLSYSDIDLVAVTQGPGAFTGLRVGISAAKSISMVLDRPAIGVCCFEAILNSCLDNIPKNKSYEYYAVILETKRDDYYAQIFDAKSMDKSGEPIFASANDIVEFIGGAESCYYMGDAVSRFEKDCSVIIDKCNISSPNIDVVARIALEDYESKVLLDQIYPVYLSMPEIGVPKKPARKLL